ncbi:MAG: RNA polymerase sigma factor [Planctomycetaceae bacterium]
MAGAANGPDDSVENEASDRTLVARLREGDESAANELYRRYAGRLHGLADRQMSAGIRRTHEPDDIVQSAFRSLFRGVSAGSYDAPEGNSLWSLLAVIAIHKVPCLLGMASCTAEALGYTFQGERC